ncbi:hypothetical protein KSP40_PGU016404 [Platanthera guangdongensis]|uniref:Geranylgeranyl reductase n=1 Tax=Platanthera guangdongensis TaxID=2320717 RepID=A0ABR2LRB0_9ASPA
MAALSSAAVAGQNSDFAGLRLASTASVGRNVARRRSLQIRAGVSSRRLSGRPLRVAVIGGGPAGGAAAETLAKGSVETVLIERKLDNSKPCGGAIPLCMVDEFDLPLEIIDRRVTKMKMISPSNVAVDIGRTLKPHEYIGMVRREVLDAYLRDRATHAGATVINGLFLKMDSPPAGSGERYKIYYNEYSSINREPARRKRWRWTQWWAPTEPTPGWRRRSVPAITSTPSPSRSASKSPTPRWSTTRTVPRCTSEMTSPQISTAGSFPNATMSPSAPAPSPTNLTSSASRPPPAFVPAIRSPAARSSASRLIPFPSTRVLGSESCGAGGDAAGYVTKCSGEGIYFAAKSGRMCAEAIVEGSAKGTRMIDEADLRNYLKKFDKTYWPTYKVLDVLQKVFYRSNSAREAFVEMCGDDYVQKMTFDSYLYKQVVPGNPLDDLKLAINTVRSLVRSSALKREMAKLAS